MSTAAALAATGARPTRVRWLIFGWVFAAAFIAYLQRTAMSVVAVPLSREAGFTTSQIGWLFNAFMITYTALQVPGGLFGQRIGPRRAVLSCTLLAIAGTLAFVLTPALASGAALFALMIGARLVIGVAHGPLFPTNSGLMQAWFPPRRWALVNGLQVMGLSLGGAAAPPIVAALMDRHGWQFAMLATCVPGLVFAVGWWWFARDAPREHAGVSAAELAVIEHGRAPAPARHFDWHQIAAVLADRNIWWLTVGYLLQNYVYYFFWNWSFSYLVEARHMTVPTSGWMTAIPLVAGALGAWLGGQWCDLACARFGPRWGFRLLPMIALPLAALLLLIASRTLSDRLAIAALAGCFFATQLTQAPFWAAAYWVAPNQASTATGVLNAGGNLGGIIGTWLVASLVSGTGWGTAIATGVGFSLASAGTWFLVDADRRVGAAA
jgi:ACS family D-galactonate transporter-like MFS transporter